MLVSKNSIIDTQDRITVRGRNDQLGGFAVSTRITGLADNDQTGFGNFRGLDGMAAGDGFLAVTQRRPSDAEPFIYVYKINDSGSITNSKLTELTSFSAAGSGTSNQFGIPRKSIAIGHGILVVGDPQATVDGVQCGRITVYDLTSGSPIFLKFIEPPTGYVSEGSNFGYSIDIGNGKIVVGAPNWSSVRSDGVIADDVGAAFVFNTTGDFLFPLLPGEYYSSSAVTTVNGTASIKETLNGEEYQYVFHGDGIQSAFNWNTIDRLKSYSTFETETWTGSTLPGIPSSYSGPLEGQFISSGLDQQWVPRSSQGPYSASHPKLYGQYWARFIYSRTHINDGDSNYSGTNHPTRDFYLAGDYHRDNEEYPDGGTTVGVGEDRVEIAGHPAFGNITVQLDQGGTYRFEHWDQFGDRPGNPPRIINLYRRYPGETSFTFLDKFEGYAEDVDNYPSQTGIMDFTLSGPAEIHIAWQHGYSGEYSNISFQLYNPNTNGRTQSSLSSLSGGEYGYDVSVGGGRIVVGSPGQNKVSIYDIDGEFKKNITASSLGLGTVGFGKAVATGCGRIAVVSQISSVSRLHVFDSNGNSAGESGSSAFSTTGTGTSDPVVRIQDNRIYATMINPQRVNVYNIDRQNIYDGTADMSVSDVDTPGYDQPGGNAFISRDIYNFAVYKNYVFAGYPFVNSFVGQVFAYYSSSDQLNNPQQHIMDIFEDQPGDAPFSNI